VRFGQVHCGNLKLALLVQFLDSLGRLVELISQVKWHMDGFHVTLAILLGLLWQLIPLGFMLRR
jgi:hypothetical protein